MNPLAAAALAAGELVCEFHDGPRASLMVYEALRATSAEVLSTRQPGRRPVHVRAAGEQLHLIQPDGPSVRVTTLTDCTRSKLRIDGEVCTRFNARHAWHFDRTAHLDPAASASRLPSGAASGSCEPWRVDQPVTQ